MNATCRCGQPCDGTYVCGSCTTSIWNTLDQVPDLLLELDAARTRQVRLARSHGRTSGHSPLPWNDAASRVRSDIEHRLWSLVAACADAGLGSTEVTQREAWPAFGDDHDASRWLMCRVEPLARVPWGIDALDLVRAATRAWRLVDHPPERIFAGPCGLCGSDLYATPGEPTVVCGACRTPEDVEERRRFLLAKVDDQLVTASEMARALTTLGQPVTPERIRQWKHRGRILPRGSNPAGVPVYRVGDVVSLLVADAERSANRAV